MPTLEHTWELMDDADEVMFIIELEVDYTISEIIPAVISAPPERCHPEEGGDCDVEAVRAMTFCAKFLYFGASNNYQWGAILPCAETYGRAFAHLFAQQHDVKQLCRDHAEAVEQDHQERGR